MDRPFLSIRTTSICNFANFNHIYHLADASQIQFYSTVVTGTRQKSNFLRSLHPEESNFVKLHVIGSRSSVIYVSVKRSHSIKPNWILVRPRENSKWILSKQKYTDIRSINCIHSVLVERWHGIRGAPPCSHWRRPWKRKNDPLPPPSSPVGNTRR